MICSRQYFNPWYYSHGTYQYEEDTNISGERTIINLEKARSLTGNGYHLIQIQTRDKFLLPI